MSKGLTAFTWALFLSLSLCVSAAPNSPAPTPGPAPDSSAALSDSLVRQGVDRLNTFALLHFTLSADLPIDADLRRRLDALSFNFVAHRRPLFERWARATLETVNGRDAPVAAIDDLGTQFLNQIGHWRLRASSSAAEQALRHAAVRPAFCRVAEKASSSLDEVAALLQAVPLSERDAAFDGEQRLMAAWDDTPADVGSTNLDPGRDLAVWVRHVRRGDRLDTPPLAPWPAGLIFVSPDEPLQRSGRCAALQWWLTTKLKQSPADAEPIWQAWHVAFARNLVLSNQPTHAFPDANDSGDYPEFVRNLRVQGTVYVSIRVDERGRVTDTMVTKRAVRSTAVPVGTSAVLFENMLDGASLARARQQAEAYYAASPPASSASTASDAWTVRTTIVWDVK